MKSNYVYIRDSKAFLELATWRRWSAFSLPRLLNCDVSEEQDCHALSEFLGSLSPGSIIPSLHIYHSNVPHHAFSTLLQSLTQCQELSVFGLSSEPFSQDFTIPVVPRAQTHWNLTSFHAYSNHLLMEPHLSSTIHILNHSPIHELTMELCISAHDHSCILPRLTMPHLRSFTFGGSIRMSYLLRFLQRHTSMEEFI